MAKKEVDDRFKKFGTVSFTSITKTNDFIDYLETILQFIQMLRDEGVDWMAATAATAAAIGNPSAISASGTA